MWMWFNERKAGTTTTKSLADTWNRETQRRFIEIRRSDQQNASANGPASRWIFLRRVRSALASVARRANEFQHACAAALMLLYGMPCRKRINGAATVTMRNGQTSNETHEYANKCYSYCIL